MSKQKRGNGVGSIYQRAGRPGWFVSVSVNGRRKIYHRGPDGSPLTKSEADQVLAEAKVQRKAGQLVAAPAQSVGAYLATWLDQIIRPEKRFGTYRGYRQCVDLYLKPTIGTVRLDRLTPAHVRQFLSDERLARLSPRTRQYALAVLKSALHEAVRLEVLARNVAENIKGPKVERDEVKPLTREEAGQLLTAARGDRLEALYSVALALGLRQGEALGLQWDDVDLDAGVLHVRQQLQRQNRQLVSVGLKTKKSRRIIKMPKAIAAAMRDHRQRQISGGKAAIGYVFATSAGAPLDGRNVVRAFKALLQRAKLRDVRFHDLRHSAASLMLAQGIPMKVVQEILGHSSFQVTSNTYSHVLPELFEDAAERMDAIFAR